MTVVVAAALLGMFAYMRNAICGRWRETGDTFGSGRQYDPGNTTQTIKTGN